MKTQNKILQSFQGNKVLTTNNTGKINSSDDSSINSERSRQELDLSESDDDKLSQIEQALSQKLFIDDIHSIEIEIGYYKTTFSEIYSIISLLGVGAFGVVIQAISKQSKQLVALKIISQENSKSLIFKNLSQEELVSEKLIHHNIINFNRIFQSQNHCIIEMEMINGGTLEKFIKDAKYKKKKNKKLEKENNSFSKISLNIFQNTEESSKKSYPEELSKKALNQVMENYHNFSDQNEMKENKRKKLIINEELASSITLGILEGINLIHHQNFVHRDLKPENILLQIKKRSELQNFKIFPGDCEIDDNIVTAKIADFGLSTEVNANIANNGSKINEVMGTMLYMAPEQATGQRYGKRIDMWALGIIVFQMLTSKHPFYQKNDTEESYKARISKENIEKLLKIYFDKYSFSDQAQNFIKKLLTRNISDRYSVGQALNHPWITRNFQREAPLTQTEQNIQIESEIKLRNIQQLFFFLSITKCGRLATAQKKNDYEFKDESSLQNRFDINQRRKTVCSVMDQMQDATQDIIDLQITKEAGSSPMKLQSQQQYKNHPRFSSYFNEVEQDQYYLTEKQIKEKQNQKFARFFESFSHNQQPDEFAEFINMTPKKIFESKLQQISPQKVQSISVSKQLLLGANQLTKQKNEQMKQIASNYLTTDYLQRIKQACLTKNNFSEVSTEEDGDYIQNQKIAENLQIAISIQTKNDYISSPKRHVKQKFSTQNDYISSNPTSTQNKQANSQIRKAGTMFQGSHRQFSQALQNNGHMVQQYHRNIVDRKKLNLLF